MGRDASEYGTKASEDTGIFSGCQVERKLKNPDLIRTVAGGGYRFVG